MRSAILLRMRARSAGEVLPQASLAAWAASSAISMSSAVERATSQSGWPVIGVGLREVLAAHRRHPLAADEVVVLRPDDDALLQLLERLMNHRMPPTSSRCAHDSASTAAWCANDRLTFGAGSSSVNSTLVGCDWTLLPSRLSRTVGSKVVAWRAVIGAADRGERAWWQGRSCWWAATLLACATGAGKLARAQPLDDVVAVGCCGSASTATIRRFSSGATAPWSASTSRSAGRLCAA